MSKWLLISLIVAACGAALWLASARSERSRHAEARAGHALLERSQRHLARAEYAAAATAAQEALAKLERAYGAHDPDAIQALEQLGVIRLQSGDLSAARALLERARALRILRHGAGHREVEARADLFAALLAAEGDLSGAQAQLEAARVARERALTQQQRELAPILYNQATVALEARDYERAEALLNRSETLFGDAEQDQRALTVQARARLAHEIGDHERAEALQTRAAAALQSVLGSAHPVSLKALAHLGYYQSRVGKHALALETLERARAGQQAAGVDPLELAETTTNIGVVLRSQGSYAPALELFGRALAAQRERLPADHPRLATNHENLGATYALLGRPAEALSQLEAALAARRARHGAAADSAETLAMLSTIELQLGRVDRALARQQEAAALDEAVVSALLGAAGERERGALMRRYEASTNEVINLHLRHAPEDPQAARLALTALLRRKGRVLESLTPRASRDPIASVDVDGVRSRLDADDALIEIAVYEPLRIESHSITQAGEARYVAYVLRAEGPVSFAELGPCAAIDADVRALRAALERLEAGHERLARALFGRLIVPLLPALGAARKLLIAAEGELHLLPFAALLDQDRRPLLQRFLVTYLTSGRDLLVAQRPPPPRTPPAVFADPDFGAMPTASHGEPRTLRFEPRAHLAREATELAALLPAAQVYARERATEAEVRALRGPALLHFATHAFVLGSREPLALAPYGLRAVQLERVDLPPLDDAPMQRAGLALSGANRALPGSGDGILTAFEAARLDLLGTELVTLGACDTGLGEIRRSEGVHGLRRAFLAAGARSVVASLWKVSDASTRALMTSFYRQLAASVPRGEALRQAQLTLLQTKATAHPFFWAAFTLAGERGPLAHDLGRAVSARAPAAPD